MPPELITSAQATDLDACLLVHFVRLRPEATPPAYQTSGAAGLDLTACPADGAPIPIPPGARALLQTGLALQIPPGYEGQVRPRSGLALRHGITVLNSPGTIDSDYRGEVMVLLINLGQETVTVRPGDRIAQIVFAPVSRAALREAVALGDTARGGGGYGHTGGLAEHAERPGQGHGRGGGEGSR